MKKLTAFLIIIASFLGLTYKLYGITPHDIYQSMTTSVAIEANQLTHSHMMHVNESDYPKLKVPWEKEPDGRLDVQPLHHGNTVYYKLTIPKANVDYQVWQAAIAEWESLDVLNFKQVPTNYHGFCIKLGGHYDPSMGNTELDNQSGKNVAIAETVFQTVYDQPHYAHFCIANASLTPMLSSYPIQVQINGAEHELGHALGFAHDNHVVNGKYHIMNWQEHANHKVIPLGKTEQHALEAVYHLPIEK